MITEAQLCLRCQFEELSPLQPQCNSSGTLQVRWELLLSLGLNLNLSGSFIPIPPMMPVEAAVLCEPPEA